MKNNDLYELIATLSSSEKKVFKEKYSGKEDGNFIRLFDAIVSGEAANDTQVKKKFANEKFVTHLHKTKAYLYEAVLQILHAQIQDSFDRFRILQKIEHAETLLSRKLNLQAEDMLQTALQESQRAEEFELEQFILCQLLGINTQMQKKQTVLDKVLISDEKFYEYKEYDRLFLAAHGTYLQRGKKGAPELAEFNKHPLLNKKHIFKSNKAERSLHITKSLLQTVSRNYKEAYNSNLRIVELLKPVVKVSIQSEVAFINALFNAVLSKQSLNENSIPLINLLAEFEPISRWATSHKFVSLLRLKLSDYTYGKRSAEGKKILKWIEQELPLHKNELNEQELIKLHLSVAGLCIKEREYNSALDFLLLFNQSKMARENRPVLYRVAMLYQLIAYYELENFEWLTTTLRNYKYFQKTNDSFYLIEKMTLDFLNEALRLSTKKERQTAKQHFVKTLLKQSDNESGLAYLKNIDWLV